MACLYISSFMTSSWIKNTKSQRSLEFALQREVTKICNGFKPMLGAFSLSIEVKNVNIFYACF